MNAQSVFDFLEKNVDLKGNGEAVKNAIKQLGVDNWGEGFHERINQQRKHGALERKRRNRFIKCFMDYLSDLTHGTKKDKIQ